MKAMNSTNIARIARAAAGSASSRLEVVGVTINAGGSTYVEILLEIRGCHADPCQLVVGVFRDVPESTLQSAIVAELNQHLAAHPTNHSRE
jgi:hypothetical protein